MKPSAPRKLCSVCGVHGARTMHEGKPTHVRCMPGERGDKERGRVLLADRPRVILQVPVTPYRTTFAPGVPWPFA